MNGSCRDPERHGSWCLPPGVVPDLLAAVARDLDDRGGFASGTNAVTERDGGTI